MNGLKRLAQYFANLVPRLVLFKIKIVGMEGRGGGKLNIFNPQPTKLTSHHISLVHIYYGRQWKSSPKSVFPNPWIAKMTSL